MTEFTTLLSETFDTAKEEGTPAFEPIPKGTYVAALTDAKVGVLKSGKGRRSKRPGKSRVALMRVDSSSIESLSSTRARTR